LGSYMRVAEPSRNRWNPKRSELALERLDHSSLSGRLWLLSDAGAKHRMSEAAKAAFLVLTRLCLLATFAFAGFSKITDPNRTRRSMEKFGVPVRFAGLVGILVPLCELGVAIGLALRATVHVAAAAALLLLIAFTTAVSVNLWKGRKPECACFGGTRPSPIGASTLGRNLILGAAGAVLLVCASDREFVRPSYPAASITGGAGGAGVWRNSCSD